MSRRGKSTAVKGGLRCPACGSVMQRYEHVKGWSPRPDQPFWFTWWDVCPGCKRVQHYEAAKQYPVLKGVEAGSGPWSAEGRPAGEGWQQVHAANKAGAIEAGAKRARPEAGPVSEGDDPPWD